MRRYVSSRTDVVTGRAKRLALPIEQPRRHGWCRAGDGRVNPETLGAPEPRVGGRQERPARKRAASEHHRVAWRRLGRRPWRRHGDAHLLGDARRGALGPLHPDPNDVLAGRDGRVGEVADDGGRRRRECRFFVEERLAVGRRHGQDRSPAAAPLRRPRRRAVQLGDNPEHRPGSARLVRLRRPGQSAGDAHRPVGARPIERGKHASARQRLRIRRGRRGGPRCDLGGRGGPIPSPRAHLDARALHAHVDATERSIGLRVGGRVADQVVVRQIRDHPIQRCRQIVALDHREAVGRAGRRLQRLEPSAQPLEILDDAADTPHLRRVGAPGRGGRLIVERLIEDSQAARVDGVETEVDAVGFVQHVEELAAVVEVRQAHAVGLALLPVRRHVRARVGPRRELAAGANVDARRLRRRHVLELPRQILVRPHERPPFADDHDALPFLAQLAEPLREASQRLDRLRFALPGDHLHGDAIETMLGIVGRVAGEVALLNRIEVVGREAARPGRPEKRLDGLGPADERQRRRVHLRRHRRDEIVGADRRFQEVAERPVDVRRRAHPRLGRQAGDGASREP